MRIKVIGLTVVFVALAGAIPAPAQPAPTSTPPRQWTPWLLTSADAFRLPPPPDSGSPETERELKELRVLQEARTSKIERRIRHWNKPPATVPWALKMLQMIKKWRPRPPFAARGLALFHTALYDAVVAASDSRSAYDRARPATLDDRINPLIAAKGSSYPPVQAVVAGAAESLLGYLFPNESAGTFSDLALKASETLLYAGVNYRSDIEQGMDLGRSVAQLFIDRAGSDGSTSTGPTYPRPAGEGYWEPTPPGSEPATGGPIGKWKPWLADTSSEYRTGSGIPGPFAYGSELFLSELHEAIDVAADLDQSQAGIAIYWDDGPGTFTPPGHWTDIAIDLIRHHEAGTNRAVRALAYLSVAEADAAIAVFEAKYFWWSIRPITAARRLCEDGARLCTKEELAADPSLATYPTWESYIITPPFPAYPGGHSTFSGAAGQVLGHFFPADAEILTDWAEEAAMSRLYGGIHFRSDNADGLILGRYVASRVLDRATSDGSSP